jgi:DeoR/GlpR family transcriptional regulator of sugar metabolism
MRQRENATEDTLLKSQRHERILSELRNSGQVHATALSATFGVSNYTIRRDLDELSQAGLLRRVHGGAVLVSPVPRTFEGRQDDALAEKALSAEAAVTMLHPDDIVIIDGGRTAQALVETIPKAYPATFITHCPETADGLADRDAREIVLIGGRLDPHSRVAVGSTTVEAYSRLSADVCFLGFWGINAVQGITSPYYEESLVRVAMVDAANTVVGLGVSAKLGTSGPFHVAPASALTYLALEPGTSAELTRPFEEAGVSILTVTR